MSIERLPPFLFLLKGLLVKTGMAGSKALEVATEAVGAMFLAVEETERCTSFLASFENFTIFGSEFKVQATLESRQLTPAVEVEITV
jgi:hypothetical protein